VREIKRQALVPYSAEAMFDLVNDVDSYPEFLPWCRAARVEEEGEGFRVASIDIAKGGVSRSFTTRNALDRPRSLRLELVNGPFRHLEGEWRFDALSEAACKVELHLRFEFASSIMNLVFGPVFNQIGETMLDAFVRRAKALHDS